MVACGTLLALTSPPPSLPIPPRRRFFDSLRVWSTLRDRRLLAPWLLSWCQCVALGEVDLQYPRAGHFSFAVAGNRVASIRVQQSPGRRVTFRGDKKIQKNLRAGGRDRRYSLRTRQWNGSPRKSTRARYFGEVLPPPNNAAAERVCRALGSSSIARARASFRKRSAGAKGNMRRADSMRRGAVADCERVRTAGLSAKRPSGRVQCKKIAF